MLKLEGLFSFYITMKWERPLRVILTSYFIYQKMEQSTLNIDRKV
jgi:hypothetical protein